MQPVRSRTYAYDNIGNRTATSQPFATTYYSNNLNQYTQINEIIAPPDGVLLTYPAYDFEGNLTNDGRFAYTWDAENRLNSATPLSPTTASKEVEFAYDYMHRRIQKKVFDWTGSAWSSTPSADTRFVYDEWNVLLELDGLNSNAILRKYTWGLDLSGQASPSAAGVHGAGGIGGLLACHDAAGNADYAYFYDANGNVGQLMNLAGGSTPAASYDYDAYGSASASGSFATTNPFRFSTKYFIPETLHYDYGRRLYDPRLGRWCSRDPIGEIGGRNLFCAFMNDAVNSFDPTGLKAYGIEGTCHNQFGDTRGSTGGPTPITYMFCRDEAEGNYYQDGVGQFGSVFGTFFGAGSSAREDKLYDQICADVCSGKPPAQINMIGWSRGAVSVLRVAHRLKEPGCCCKTRTVKRCCKQKDFDFEYEEKVCAEWTKPTVNFLAMIDPVDRNPRTVDETIPSNVKTCAVVRTVPKWWWIGQTIVFPYAGGRYANDFTVEDPNSTSYQTCPIQQTHGQAGTGATANDFIRGCARRAGVQFK